ncbi:hypothetical protein FB451DRAFT_1178887 [Mycena latifolia]|nr:hypothetical protein FB451DRAFT_1178887 [Mycena latifolia]
MADTLVTTIASLRATGKTDRPWGAVAESALVSPALSSEELLAHQPRFDAFSKAIGCKPATANFRAFDDRFELKHRRPWSALVPMPDRQVDQNSTTHGVLPRLRHIDLCRPRAQVGNPEDNTVALAARGVDESAPSVPLAMSCNQSEALNP